MTSYAFDGIRKIIDGKDLFYVLGVVVFVIMEAQLPKMALMLFEGVPINHYNQIKPHLPSTVTVEKIFIL